jgi:hypothetical protein
MRRTSNEQPDTPDPGPPSKRRRLREVKLGSTSSEALIAAQPAEPSVTEPPVNTPGGAPAEPLAIQKPKGGGLAKFKAANLEPEKVTALLPGLPHYPIAAAKDWVRLHPNEANYWSDEYCFVNIPVPGQKKETLHLIATDLAIKIPPGRVQKSRLALASKPHDIFFLAEVPTRNLDNKWNETNLAGCQQAKTLWTQLTSLRETGAEGYKIDISDAEKRGKKPLPGPGVVETE